MTASARILMLPSGIGRSHERRLQLLAAALRSRTAAQVTVASAQPGATGGPDRRGTLPEASVADFDQDVYAAWSPELVRASVQAERALVEDVRPDLLVSDLRPSARITSALTGVPCVSVMNAALSRQFDPALLLSTRGGPARQVAARLGRAMQLVQKRTSVGAFRQVAGEHGLHHLRSLDDLLEGDLTLLADARELWPLGQLPSTTRWVGPVVWDGPAEADGGWRPPDDDRGLVYVTVGNTGSLRLVDLAVEAFADVPEVHVLITTGDRPTAYDSARLPDHVQVRGSVHGPTAVRRADVVVHVGGNGTAYQVLREGTPAVAVPFTNDQRANAAVLARAGLALALDPRRTGPQALRAAAHRVGTDRRMSDALARTRPLVQVDGATAAAEEIVRLLPR